jgi:hypothetical protein
MGILQKELPACAPMYKLPDDETATVPGLHLKEKKEKEKKEKKERRRSSSHSRSSSLASSGGIVLKLKIKLGDPPTPTLEETELSLEAGSHASMDTGLFADAFAGAEAALQEEMVQPKTEPYPADYAVSIDEIANALGMEEPPSAAMELSADPGFDAAEDAASGAAALLLEGEGIMVEGVDAAALLLEGESAMVEEVAQAEAGAAALLLEGESAMAEEVAQAEVAAIGEAVADIASIALSTEAIARADAPAHEALASTDEASGVQTANDKVEEAALAIISADASPEHATTDLPDAEKPGHLSDAVRPGHIVNNSVFSPANDAEATVSASDTPVVASLKPAVSTDAANTPRQIVASVEEPSGPASKLSPTATLA